ncbi:MAG: hypothetical protein MSC30_16990 [Gaiellaceae bacterium MAG52_C11]|nr:hypothetical protein [Candidatus Gaiellasilicea maunaloa]
MSAWWIAAVVSLWAVVMIVGVILLGFLRRVTAVLERAEAAVTSGQVNLGGAYVGMQMDAFIALDRSGREVSSDDLFASPATYLLLHSGCEPCHRLIEKLGQLAAATPVIAILDESPNSRELELPGGILPLFDRDGSVGRAFKNGGTPQAFAVLPGGFVAETLVPGSAEDIEKLSSRLTEGGDAVVESSEVVRVA